ncbi:MAG: succinyldiaminopimelate transaminase [Pelistega sp.]|nr:succinyldiaminopimelate transaminase [Pelistega sp.]
MNPRLQSLNPYPFEKLRLLLADSQAQTSSLSPINLSIGEPKHTTPELIKQAIIRHLDGLATYPATKGDLALRDTISQWLSRRYQITAPNPETQVLPCLGSREALFAFAQVVLDGAQDSIVVCPNPFYQIYEGAAFLAGARPYFVNALAERNFSPDWQSVPESVWQKTQLLYICSPGNPAGNVTPLEEWQYLFELSERYDFIIASDECYSEIYFDAPPIGILQAAQLSGRQDYRNMVCFSSLSKRSNVPGMRSGFVAGDANILAKFLQYRTYHGSALSPVYSAASIAAWNDETHVEDNRHQYRAKFAAVQPILSEVLDVKMPDASFYLWAGTPVADDDFVKALYQEMNVTLVPGSYLARAGSANGVNPGLQRTRIALVAPIEQCIEGAQRIADFVRKHYV